MRTEYLNIKSFDGYILNLKLDLPDSNIVEKLIVYCHGTGPNTYDNRRKINDIEFNYFDLFSREFTKRGIGFCRWNTRGCNISTMPPNYVDINMEEYRSYTPLNSIKDILSVVDNLREMDDFKNSKIILFGASEGATLIPIAAEKLKNISGLLLMGFSYGNLNDTVNWQLSGGSSMVNMRKYFDYDNKGFITKIDLEEDGYNIRDSLLKNIEFEDLDINKDGILNEEDYKILLSDYRDEFFNAIENEDDNWLKDSYPVLITSKWYKEHLKLPSQKDILLKLDMPIFIFQGENDANIPLSDIEKIRCDFKINNKDNLKIFIFKNHDHDLNYLLYPMNNIISEGLESIFNIALEF